MVQRKSITAKLGAGIYFRVAASARTASEDGEGNATGLSTLGGTIFSYGNNRLFGNATDGVSPASLPLK